MGLWQAMERTVAHMPRRSQMVVLQMQGRIRKMKVLSILILVPSVDMAAQDPRMMSVLACSFLFIMRQRHNNITYPKKSTRTIFEKFRYPI